MLYKLLKRLLLLSAVGLFLLNFTGKVSLFPLFARHCHSTSIVGLGREVVCKYMKTPEQIILFLLFVLIGYLLWHFWDERMKDRNVSNHSLKPPNSQ